MLRRVVSCAPEVCAALAGIAAVVLALLLLRGLATHHGGAAAAPLAARPVNRSTANPRSPAGAVQAATDDLVALSQAMLSSSQAARAAVDADVIGPLRRDFERALPLVAAAVEARLAQGQSPAVLDGLPLGYRVLSFTGGTARISIWTLQIGVSSALPLASTEYQTTTLLLRWAAGRWRIAAASSAPGPTPPTGVTAATRLDAFARELTSYRWYRDEP